MQTAITQQRRVLLDGGLVVGTLAVVLFCVDRSASPAAQMDWHLMASTWPNLSTNIESVRLSCPDSAEDIRQDLNLLLSTVMRNRPSEDSVVFAYASIQVRECAIDRVVDSLFPGPTGQLPCGSPSPTTLSYFFSPIENTFNNYAVENERAEPLLVSGSLEEAVHVLGDELLRDIALVGTSFPN